VIKVKDNQLPSIPERLSQMVVRCCGCNGEWLLLGLQTGDTYICKECGHRFIVGSPPMADSSSAVCRCQSMMMNSLPSSL
jgi:DNA-directed RNA polymerase subunit RPC12/RpoP